MRTRSIAGVLTLVLAVAVIGAGTAFAQTPKPKAEKPPTAAKPPNPAKPPTATKPKPATPPKATKPPKPAKPAATPNRPTLAQPKPAQANAPSAQPDEPARSRGEDTRPFRRAPAGRACTEPRGEVTTTVPRAPRPLRPSPPPAPVPPAPTIGNGLGQQRRRSRRRHPHGPRTSQCCARTRASFGDNNVSEATVPVDRPQARLPTIDSLTATTCRYCCTRCYSPSSLRSASAITSDASLGLAEHRRATTTTSCGPLRPARSSTL